MRAGQGTDVAIPERGLIYSRRGTQRSEWWRVSELRRGAEEIHVVLTRIDNGHEQLVIAAPKLEHGGEFERVEARFGGR